LRIAFPIVEDEHIFIRQLGTRPGFITLTKIAAHLSMAHNSKKEYERKIQRFPNYTHQTFVSTKAYLLKTAGLHHFIAILLAGCAETTLFFSAIGAEFASIVQQFLVRQANGQFVSRRHVFALFHSFTNIRGEYLLGADIEGLVAIIKFNLQYNIV